MKYIAPSVVCVSVSFAASHKTTLNNVTPDPLETLLLHQWSNKPRKELGVKFMSFVFRGQFEVIMMSIKQCGENKDLYNF